MNEKKKKISVELSSAMRDKFKYICSQEDRSMNKKVMLLIRECIHAFEAEHGEIRLPDDI